ncbi:MAG: LacI family DNA-binding transcriptional regulator [Chloroflexota bacterium]|nr:LacI family DNA-binding transcriptional regulator [Anaerolineales bacterium]
MSKKSVKTIEDIARLANVSKSTVSRALNNSSLVKQETREQIQAIAREYNFRLNAPARNLSMRQSHMVAYVTHAYHQSFSVDDLFGLEIMGSIAAQLANLSYDFLVVHVNPKDTEWAHKYLDSGRVDGFILMTSSRKQTHIKTLVEMNAPFIVWGAPNPKYNYCSVSGDNVTGGRVATEHLVRGGRRRIAFLGGPADELEVQQRFQGYKSALAEVGCSADHDKLLAYGDYSHASGITAMRHLLEQSPDLDAVFANSDLMAIGAISVIQSSGRRVPDDVAVVGYDDLSIAAFNNVPLTTVRQNIPLAGKLLAQNLIQYIRTGVVTNVTVPVELIVRESA